MVNKDTFNKAAVANAGYPAYTVISEEKMIKAMERVSRLINLNNVDLVEKGRDLWYESESHVQFFFRTLPKQKIQEMRDEVLHLLYLLSLVIVTIEEQD